MAAKEFGVQLRPYPFPTMPRWLAVGGYCFPNDATKMESGRYWYTLLCGLMRHLFGIYFEFLMSIFLNAFRVGETVQLADVKTLDTLQQEFSDRQIIVPNMSQYAGLRVQIRQADRADGYQFFEIDGRWMESALLDICLQPEIQYTDPISYALASETYIASPESNVSPGFVSIADKAGELFFRFRSFCPESDANTLNLIAIKRCRIAFESNLGFYPKYSEYDR